MNLAFKLYCLLKYELTVQPNPKPVITPHPADNMQFPLLILMKINQTAQQVKAKLAKNNGFIFTSLLFLFYYIIKFYKSQAMINHFRLKLTNIKNFDII